jgi:hypothetical protein
LCTAFNELNYKSIDLPFECTVWQSGNSFVEQKSNKIIIFPCPFSQDLKGIYPIKYVSSLENIVETDDIFRGSCNVCISEYSLYCNNIKRYVYKCYNTHKKKDTMEIVDIKLLEKLGKTIAIILEIIDA